MTQSNVPKALNPLMNVPSWIMFVGMKSPENKILSSFTHPCFIPRLYDITYFVEQDSCMCLMIAFCEEQAKITESLSWALDQLNKSVNTMRTIRNT